MSVSRFIKGFVHRVKYVVLFLVIVAFCVIFFPAKNLCKGAGIAGKYELPAEVIVVNNEREMIKDFVKGLKNHKEEFNYYYPGIERQFLKYEKKGCRPFFDKVAEKNGYLAGIISGYCVSFAGDDLRYVTIQVCYLTTKKQERKIDKRVKKIVKKIGKGSRRTKIKKAHDYLVKNMQYDKRYYSPYDAFTKGRGMCMAYALSFQRLMQEMNIPCRYIKGNNHAWNMVNVSGRWYYIDVTFDDSSDSYRYFLSGKSVFEK